MKKQTVTITDLAKALDLNISTVSRALQNHPRISKETRAKVQKMAQRLHYEPNIMAAGLRSGKSRSIGVIVPHINRFFFSNVIGGIEMIANKNGFNTIICQSHDSYESEAACIQTLLNSSVDGIVMSLAMNTRSLVHLKQIKNKDIPFVMFDRVNDKAEVSSVVLNDYQGAYKATEHLIKMGYKKIAHLAGPQHINIYKDRFSGYCDALQKHHLPIVEKRIAQALTREAAMKAITAMMSSHHMPDAVFAASDFSALGTYELMINKKLKIPEEMGIVGFANEPFTEFMGISSVEQHPIEMGKQIAELFFEELNQPEKKEKAVKIIIEPELIIRASSTR